MKTFLLGICVLLCFLSACKKSNNEVVNCYPDALTIRSIINKPATVRQLSSGEFYLIEAGTIDSRLIPCELPEAFKINNLNVFVTGEVKGILQPPLAPCCSEGFVIFKITL